MFGYFLDYLNNKMRQYWMTAYIRLISLFKTVYTAPKRTHSLCGLLISSSIFFDHIEFNDTRVLSFQVKSQPGHPEINA